MSLNKHQIDQIKAFIHSRGFKHIEVETEILDHVASAVEKKLEENPEKPLEKAINEVHASFGVFGFADFEEAKYKQIRGMIYSRFWQNVKKQLSIKHFTSNILIITLLYLSFYLIQDQFLLYWLFPVVLSIGLIIFNIPFSKQQRQKYYKWRGRSVMMGSLGYPLAFCIPNLANIVGRAIEDLMPNYPMLGAIVFISLNLFIIITSLASKKTFNWGFKWVNESYLKYETV